MNPSLPLRSPEMISLPLSLSQHKPRHRIGQGATSGSPGPLGAWVPGPSPRAEGPLWLPGLVWSLGPWLRLRGRPTRAHRGGPPPGEKTGWWPVPGGAAALAGFIPQGKRGCSAACGQKMAALHRLRPAPQSGCWRGPSSRVCACPGVWEGAWSSASRAPSGDHCFGWASRKVWLLWPRPGATGGSLHSGGLYPGLYPRIVR